MSEEEEKPSKYKIVDMTDEQFERIIEASEKGKQLQKIVTQALNIIKKQNPDVFDVIVSDYYWDENGIAHVEVKCKTLMKGWPLFIWKMREFYHRLCNLE